MKNLENKIVEIEKTMSKLDTTKSALQVMGANADHLIDAINFLNELRANLIKENLIKG